MSDSIVRGCQRCGKRLRGERAKYCSRPCYKAHLQAPEVVAARFWPKVDKDGPLPAHRPELGPCWLWTARVSHNGYGRFALTHSKSVPAHHFAYETATSVDVPDGLLVCHHCDNPPCVNPGHLFLGTQLDNMRDKVAKGRGARQCGSEHGGAKLNEALAIRIREMYSTGQCTQRDVADTFAVSQGTVSRIVTRTRWTHV